jgi:FkbM family methyltransferase
MARPFFHIRQLLKKAVKSLPIALTQNQRYDAQTAAIIRRICTAGSNCIDVGTHRGEILDLFLKSAPGGTHVGVEPLPELFGFLVEKYRGRPNVKLYDVALSVTNGSATFNHVTTNPAYSGLRKRAYDRPEKDETLTVQTRLLDDLAMAPGIRFSLIKIDVEGGEMGVLRGGHGLLERDRPVVIFEAGIGGSDVYGTTADDLYRFFDSLGYRLSLMADYLAGRPHLTADGFRRQFDERLNYYFVALP